MLRKPIVALPLLPTAIVVSLEGPLESATGEAGIESSDALALVGVEAIAELVGQVVLALLLEKLVLVAIVATGMRPQALVNQQCP